MGKSRVVLSFFLALCHILALGQCQWTYPPMATVSPQMQMPVQFPQPTIFPAAPYMMQMQPSCYTVCYPPPLPTPIMANPSTCTPPTTTLAPVDTCTTEPPSKPTTPVDTTPPTSSVPSTTEQTPIVKGLRKKNFTATFELGNYPLDFYYLMDYSGSFRDDKKSLVELSPKLIDTIKNLSSDYQLGFGSFVDKPLPPFGSSGDYSFWHQITLSNNTSTFTQTVLDTPILFGGDGPEGIFEGLYQAAVCTSEVGWRSNARKILLVATDAPYHKAGEGLDKQGLPEFDGKCHLDTQGKYSEEATMDYPSEDQIKTVMEDNQIVVIFAVTAESTNFYTDLSQSISSSKLATLSADSSNVIDLITDAYNEISSTVEIEASGATADATISYFTSCSGTEEKKTVCSLPPSGSVSYTVEVEMDCPIDPSKTLSVNPVGIPSNVDIDISFICI